MSGAPSEATRVRRHPERGAYDRATIHAIIDAALICHVGIVEDGRPVIIPMIHSRSDATLYLHGSYSSRLLNTLAERGPTCVTFALVDGLVLASTALHHSMNYRSAVVFGTGRRVSTGEEKLVAMRGVVDRLLPGRWQELPEPSAEDIRATQIVAIDIGEASAKIRTGGPREPESEGSSVWTGLIPLALRPLSPIPAQTSANRPLPPSAAGVLLADFLNVPRGLAPGGSNRAEPEGDPGAHL